MAEQLEARARRNHEAIACLAFSPLPAGVESTNPRSSEELESFADFAHIVREQARKSDVVAKTGESQLALLAPDTDAAGARLLVARLLREIEASSKNSARPGSIRLRTGYCAVSDLSMASVDLNELVQRAESALAYVPTNGDSGSLVSFDDLPQA
jgi:GGDEF domain-containing protein